MLKRIFDILVAFTGLLLLMPLFAIVSILVKLDSRGPVLFKHKRVGKDGRLFTLYKFRSMRVNPEAEEGWFEPGNRERVTRFGKFIRKTKIDELPQLINIIKGEMSLVGPRPEVEKWVSVYPERWKKVLKVKPGMTDKASIEFRHEETLLSESADPEKTYRVDILPKKLDLYEDYAANNSLLNDIALIFKTLTSMLGFK